VLRGELAVWHFGQALIMKGVVESAGRDYMGDTGFEPVPSIPVKAGSVVAPSSPNTQSFVDATASGGVVVTRGEEVELHVVYC
jgi:hypothetical protein